MIYHAMATTILAHLYISTLQQTSLPPDIPAGHSARFYLLLRRFVTLRVHADAGHLQKHYQRRPGHFVCCILYIKGYTIVVVFFCRTMFIGFE